ncbi:hypothetical protein BJX66DRAFT_296083 [Aspergillus keveii]|uniref:F-box domain-containing protein n=1 Tax=Aspergillus keveii TaxID=714993 RepID=A0ABR4GGT6_9EURO
MCARQRQLLVPTDENACSKTINDNDNTTTEVIRLTCPPPHIPFDDFYIFHQVCWEQLSSHFHPEELDLDRLYAALQYMPVPKRTVPKRPRTVTPTLEQLMVAPKPRPWLALPPAPLVVNITDGFRRLPLELKEQLAAILSAKDVLNLRLASRAMGLLFESCLFWQTRFDIDIERGFLVPVLKNLSVEERRKLDWRLLYHCTCNFRCSWTFRDTHIEMWERLRWLRDMTMEARLDDLKSPWFFDGRALQHYHNTHYS